MSLRIIENFFIFCLLFTYGEQNLNILKSNSVGTVQEASEGICGKELFSLKPHLLAQIQIYIQTINL